MTAAMTGLRTGELLGLRWEAIDLDRAARACPAGMRGEFTTPKSARGEP